jgi:hypothetical protein
MLQPQNRLLKDEAEGCTDLSDSKYNKRLKISLLGMTPLEFLETS